jgi:hypothetical protein
MKAKIKFQQIAMATAEEEAIRRNEGKLRFGELEITWAPEARIMPK